MAVDPRSYIGEAVAKYFPGHSQLFHGIVTEYHPPEWEEGENGEEGHVTQPLWTVEYEEDSDKEDQEEEELKACIQLAEDNKHLGRRRQPQGETDEDYGKHKKVKARAGKSPSKNGKAKAQSPSSSWSQAAAAKRAPGGSSSARHAPAAVEEEGSDGNFSDYAEAAYGGKEESFYPAFPLEPQPHRDALSTLLSPMFERVICHTSVPDAARLSRACRRLETRLRSAASLRALSLTAVGISVTDGRSPVNPGVTGTPGSASPAPAALCDEPGWRHLLSDYMLVGGSGGPPAAAAAAAPVPSLPVPLAAEVRSNTSGLGAREGGGDILALLPHPNRQLQLLLLVRRGAMYFLDADTLEAAPQGHWQPPLPRLRLALPATVAGVNGEVVIVASAYMPQRQINCNSAGARPGMTRDGYSGVVDRGSAAAEAAAGAGAHLTAETGEALLSCVAYTDYLQRNTFFANQPSSLRKRS